MFNLKSISIALVCMGIISCSTPDENSRPEEGTTRTSSVAFAAEGAGDLSVYVFNKSNNDFLFQSVINDGWVDRDDKKIRLVDLVHGDYKFVFLANQLTNLTLPEAVTRSEGFKFENWVISHKVYNKDGWFAGADEIFMQDDMEKAALSHTVSGNKTIEANLTRAVAKIDVRIARGYMDEGQQGEDVFVPEPYTNGGNVADLFEGYEIEVIDCGAHISIGGSNGTAKVYEAYVAGDDAIRTIGENDEDNEDGLKTGFVVLNGPFILPPAESSDMQVRVRLFPTAESGLDNFEKLLVNSPDVNLNIPRNHKLIITFWVENLPGAAPTISVTVDVADMSKEVTGDSGMWY